MHARVPRRSIADALLSSAALVVIWLVAALPAAAQSYGGGATSAPVMSSHATLGTRSTTSLGTFLVGPNGMTLYTLSSDPANGSICTGQCLSFWPALVVPTGGSAGASGVSGTFATFTRPDDGASQVTYNGRALYYFANDTAPGQTNGEGIRANGGVWHVAKVTAASTRGTTATPAAGSSGAGAGGGSTGSDATSTAPATSSPPTDTSAPGIPVLLLLVVLLAATVGSGLVLARGRATTRRPR